MEDRLFRININVKTFSVEGSGLKRTHSLRVVSALAESLERAKQKALAQVIGFYEDHMGATLDLWDESVTWAILSYQACGEENLNHVVLWYDVEEEVLDRVLHP